MKIVGLITEYNPFHTGHKYHIEKAKEITGADYCIAVMSGDFVQRGAPAFLPKHLRTEMALAGGCDMIIELPVCYAAGSAEYFATGAISILDSLGCIDAVCFGSECGDYHTLEQIAQVLVSEPAPYKESLKQYLKNGMNFPLARQKALSEYFNGKISEHILEEPNNILGIEYIKAMIMRNSHMKGYTIARKDSAYHEQNLSAVYSSASAIRNVLSSSKAPSFENLKGHLTDQAIRILSSKYMVRYPIYPDDFSLLLRYKLLTETKETLVDYLDVSQEISNRIMNARNNFLNFSQFCELLKTREITYSRISRCLIHILLNIKKCDIKPLSYARILGFRKESSELFSKLKMTSEIPILTRLSLSDNLSPEIEKMVAQDIFASDLYESVVSEKFHTPFINELTKQIVKS